MLFQMFPTLLRYCLSCFLCLSVLFAACLSWLPCSCCFPFFVINCLYVFCLCCADLVLYDLCLCLSARVSVCACVRSVFYVSVFSPHASLLRFLVCCCCPCQSCSVFLRNLCDLFCVFSLLFLYMLLRLRPLASTCLSVPSRPSARFPELAAVSSCVSVRAWPRLSALLRVLSVSVCF